MKRALLALPALLLAVLALAGCAGSSGIRPMIVDGEFDDWSNVPVLADDPPGDATGGFDVTTIKAASRGSVLYLMFDTGKELNVQDGPREEGTLAFRFGLPDGQTLVVDLRRRRARMASSAHSLPWEWIDFIIAPTHSAKQFEMRIDLGRFGVGQGDRVTIDLAESDTLAQPAVFTLEEHAICPERRTPGRAPETDLRIACQNTWWHGLTDDGRAAPLGRVLRAVAADVYCFQEEWDTGVDTVKRRLLELLKSPASRGLPRGLVYRMHIAAGPFIHKVSGCVIASGYPLSPVPSNNNRYAAAVVHHPKGPVLVVSVHFTATGYIGNERDLARIEEVKGLIATIRSFRAGEFGDELAAYRHAPFAIVGDYNLVGSPTPLNLLVDELPAKAWLLRHLVGQDIYTWRDGVTASFAPGRLDCVTHSPEGLVPLKGYILDTAKLNTRELKALGLEKDDSTFSDHLMMVTDFGIR